MSTVPYDLRGIYVAKYAYSSTSGISYSGGLCMGNAMTLNMELKSAEGRLYAESALQKYRKKTTGGTISVGVDELSLAVKKLLYGWRDVTYTESGATSGAGFGSDTTAQYVGLACYQPADADSGDKYICMFIRKCLFSEPSMSYETAGENVNFQTPTTSGEFVQPDGKDASGNKNLMVEFAEADTEANALAWVKARLSITG